MLHGSPTTAHGTVHAGLFWYLSSLFHVSDIRLDPERPFNVDLVLIELQQKHD